MREVRFSRPKQFMPEICTKFFARARESYFKKFDFKSLRKDQVNNFYEL